MGVTERKGKGMEDHGFFGPGSVAWRVWGYPTSLTVGFQRAVVVEELDPFLLASVEATNRVRANPRGRYDNTIRYFATVAFADSSTAVNASAALMRVHSRNVGPEPVSGLTYDANDPDSQLWILLTGWHSVLYAYERYGPGKLSPEEEREYWEQCAVAAELQTCDSAKVPRTREGVRAYFEEVRPRLAATEATQAMMAHLLTADVILPRRPAVLRPVNRVIGSMLRAATVATIPRWQRDLAALRQPRIVDLAIRLPMRIAFWVAARSARLQLAILGLISPRTVPIVEPYLRRTEPQRPETLTPAEAFRRHGVPDPAELREVLTRERPVRPSPEPARKPEPVLT